MGTKFGNKISHPENSLEGYAYVIFTIQWLREKKIDDAEIVECEWIILRLQQYYMFKRQQTYRFSEL